MKPTSTWKSTERKVAALVGGQRVGCGTDRADVRAGDWLVCEVKHRAELPQWLTESVDQAQRYAGEFQLPVSVLHAAGTPVRESLVVMRLSDFVAWFGPTPYEAETPEGREGVTEAGVTYVIQRQAGKNTNGEGQ